MTPKFYTHFSLLQKTFAAFNQKCDCKGIDATISFAQVLKTKSDNDTSLWIALFESEDFGNQRFGGTLERVTELVSGFIYQIVEQTLEACIANAEGENGWFNGKPEVVEEIYEIYHSFKKVEKP